MERKVLCLPSKGENGASRVVAEHSEILAEGLLLEVELHAVAYVRNYVSYPEGRITYTPATALGLSYSYRLFHFGNKIRNIERSSEVLRMGWLQKRVPILDPLSIHNQTIRAYVEGSGPIVRDMPALDVEVRKRRRHGKAYLAENPLVADVVRLPKYLVITFMPTVEEESTD